MENSIIIPSEKIVSKIYIIRNRKVMIDRDLAKLYDVPTKSLNLAVKRNIKRFPEDFMFQLSKEELKIWRFQIETSKSDKMGLRRPPHAFTEHGVAMLSSVLLNIHHPFILLISLSKSLTRFLCSSARYLSYSPFAIFSS